MKLFCIVIGLLVLMHSHAQTSFKLTDTTFSVGQEYQLHPIRVSECYGFYMEPESSLLLDSIANWLKQYPEIIIEIGVHSDSRGSTQNNRLWTLKKAELIKRFLLERGVNHNQLTCKGYGEDQPIVPEEDIQAFKSDKRQFEMMHQQNRRELLIITAISQ